MANPNERVSRCHKDCSLAPAHEGYQCRKRVALSVNEIGAHAEIRLERRLREEPRVSNYDHCACARQGEQAAKSNPQDGCRNDRKRERREKNMESLGCPRCHIGIDDDHDGNCSTCAKWTDAQLANVLAKRRETIYSAAPVASGGAQPEFKPEWESFAWNARQEPGADDIKAIRWWMAALMAQFASLAEELRDKLAAKDKEIAKLTQENTDTDVFLNDKDARITELEAALAKANDDLKNCGRENCMGQAVEGCRSWVSKERLESEQRRVEAVESALQRERDAHTSVIEALESVERQAIETSNDPYIAGLIRNVIARLRSYPSTSTCHYCGTLIRQNDSDRWVHQSHGNALCAVWTGNVRPTATPKLPRRGADRLPRASRIIAGGR